MTRQQNPFQKRLNLPAQCRIQMLPEKPEPVLLRQILNKVAGLGRIHAAQTSFSFS